MRGCRLSGSEGQGRVARALQRETGGGGGSTAGQYTQCTYKCGFDKVATQHLVALLENRWFLDPASPGACPLRQATQGQAPYSLKCLVLIIRGLWGINAPIPRDTTLDIYFTVHRTRLLKPHMMLRSIASTPPLVLEGIAPSSSGRTDI